MFCTKCGSELVQGAKFCSMCGSQVAQDLLVLKQNQEEFNEDSVSNLNVDFESDREIDPSHIPLNSENESISGSSQDDSTKNTEGGDNVTSSQIDESSRHSSEPEAEKKSMDTSSFSRIPQNKGVIALWVATAFFVIWIVGGENTQKEISERYGSEFASFCEDVFKGFNARQIAERIDEWHRAGLSKNNINPFRQIRKFMQASNATYDDIMEYCARPGGKIFQKERLSPLMGMESSISNCYTIFTSLHSGILTRREVLRGAGPTEHFLLGLKRRQ